MSLFWELLTDVIPVDFNSPVSPAHDRIVRDAHYGI